MISLNPVVSRREVVDLVSGHDPAMVLANDGDAVATYVYRDSYSIGALTVPDDATVYQCRGLKRDDFRRAEGLAGRRHPNGARVEGELRRAGAKAETGEAYVAEYTRAKERLSDEDDAAHEAWKEWERRRCALVVSLSMERLIGTRRGEPAVIEFAEDRRFDPEWFRDAVESNKRDKLLVLMERRDALREQSEAISAAIAALPEPSEAEGEKELPPASDAAKATAAKLERLGLDAEGALAFARAAEADGIEDVADYVADAVAIDSEIAAYRQLDPDDVLAELARHIETVSRLGKAKWGFSVSLPGTEATLKTSTPGIASNA